VAMDMKGELSSAGLYTDFSGLARLRSEASQKSPEANREVAQQFEALFLQSMIKAMRDASQMSDSTDGEQTRFYQEMFDKQIALDLSRTGSLGLANALEQQFNGVSNLQLNNRGGNYSSVNGFPVVTAAHNQPSQPVASWTPATPEDFTRELWPHAVEAAKQLGVAPEVLVAQSALETGWGKKVIQHPQGQQQGHSSFNLFGIKADHRWQGERVTVDTLEFRDGIAQREKADFRAYESIADSMQDYVNFLNDNPRYQHALQNSADPASYLHELQKAGYSTDPEYASKIQAIINRESFDNTISQIQLKPATAPA